MLIKSKANISKSLSYLFTICFYDHSSKNLVAIINPPDSLLVGGEI